MIGLTDRQLALLGFIKSYVAQHGGVAPTYEEMAAAQGIRKSGAHRLVLCLEERGYVRRLPLRDRAIEVVGVHERLAQFSDADLTAELERRRASHCVHNQSHAVEVANG